MPIQQAGRDLWASALSDPSGATGTTTSGPTATTVTDTGATWTTNQWYGHDVVVGGVVMTVLSNTGTVLTGARWETPGSRGGATASTPSSGTYVICSGQAPAAWIALTASVISPSTGGTDTTLAGEITTAGSGFIRALATFGHTAGTNTYTLTKTFTATGSDSFPQNVKGFGVFQAQNSGRLLFEDSITTFQANQVGDAMALTDTCTGT